MKYAQQFKISDEYSCIECYDRDDQEFSMASKNIGIAFRVKITKIFLEDFYSPGT